MNADPSPVADEMVRHRRLVLAQQAYREFFAKCFWSSDPDYQIQEGDLSWVIRNLRENGGHRGYRIVAELCR